MDVKFLDRFIDLENHLKNKSENEVYRAKKIISEYFINLYNNFDEEKIYDKLCTELKTLNINIKKDLNIKILDHFHNIENTVLTVMVAYSIKNMNYV